MLNVIVVLAVKLDFVLLLNCILHLFLALKQYVQKCRQKEAEIQKVYNQRQQNFHQKVLFKKEQIQVKV